MRCFQRALSALVACVSELPHTRWHKPCDVSTFRYPKESRRALSQSDGGVTVQHKTPAFNTLITLSAALVSLIQGDNIFFIILPHHIRGAIRWLKSQRGEGMRG